MLLRLLDLILELSLLGSLLLYSLWLCMRDEVLIRKLCHRPRKELLSLLDLRLESLYLCLDVDGFTHEDKGFKANSCGRKRTLHILCSIGINGD